MNVNILFYTEIIPYYLLLFDLLNIDEQIHYYSFYYSKTLCDNWFTPFKKIRSFPVSLKHYRSVIQQNRYLHGIIPTSY